jgi:archaellum component FlaC
MESGGKQMSEQILESILGELKGVNQRLDGMDQSLDRMDQRFDGIDQRLDRMDQRFDGIDQRLDRMDQRFDGIDQRLDRMDQRFDRIESTLDEVKIAVLETHEWVGAIAVVQEQQAVAIESLRTEQLRHGKIIEALAVKSFEHDADIRELKRAR